MAIKRNQVTGLLIAGGKGSRMNFADKPLIKLGNKPLIQWVLLEARQHTRKFFINVNRNFEKYRRFGLPLLPDLPNAPSGPLAGIHSGMEFIATEKDLYSPHFLLCLPGDVPFFPKDLIPNLLVEMENKPCDVIFTRVCDQIEPLFSLWSYSARTRISNAIEEGLHGPRQIFPLLNTRELPINNSSHLDFLNINTVKDLTLAKKLLKAQ